MRNPLYRLIERVGSVANLAKIVGCSRQLLYDHLNGRAVNFSPRIYSGLRRHLPGVDAGCIRGEWVSWKRGGQDGRTRGSGSEARA